MRTPHYTAFRVKVVPSKSSTEGKQILNSGNLCTETTPEDTGTHCSDVLWINLDHLKTTAPSQYLLPVFLHHVLLSANFKIWLGGKHFPMKVTFPVTNAYSTARDTSYFVTGLKNWKQVRWSVKSSMERRRCWRMSCFQKEALTCTFLPDLPNSPNILVHKKNCNSSIERNMKKIDCVRTGFRR